VPAACADQGVIKLQRQESSGKLSGQGKLLKRRLTSRRKVKEKQGREENDCWPIFTESNIQGGMNAKSSFRLLVDEGREGENRNTKNLTKGSRGGFHSPRSGTDEDGREHKQKSHQDSPFFVYKSIRRRRINEGGKPVVLKFQNQHGGGRESD